MCTVISPYTAFTANQLMDSIRCYSSQHLATNALAKPYCKAYVNYWDIAILSHLASLLYLLSSGSCELILVRILLSIPICIFILYQENDMTCVNILNLSATKVLYLLQIK